MDNREDFEKWYDNLNNTVGAAYQAWQYQQKIIDELKAENPDVPCPARKGEIKKPIPHSGEWVREDEDPGKRIN